MSNNTNLLEQYHRARTMFNVVNDQQETLYHKRQRIALENLRTNAYKYTLIQTKRREKFKYRYNKTSHHPIRLSTNIRQIFQVKKENSSYSNISIPIKMNTLPPRIYPPIFNLRQVISKQSINVNILHQIYYLGQFDRKFLIYKHIIHSSNIKQIQLIVFDQHAISERILLEQLQKYFQKDNIYTISYKLSEPIVINRNPRFLYTYEQILLLERTGFSFSSISTHNLLVRSIPTWLLTLNQRQRSSTSIFNDIIYNTINNILHQTLNSSNNIQLIIYETLKSLACHNAIKFNDILTSIECKHLLNELKICSMPFICAHGRISSAILWEYDIIFEKYQVDMIELKQLASIHKWLKLS